MTALCSFPRQATLALRRSLVVFLLCAVLVAAGVGRSAAPAWGQAKGSEEASDERFDTVDWTAVGAPVEAFDRLTESARGESIGAIVGLQVRFTPEGTLSPLTVDRQRAAIRSAGQSLVRALAGTEFTTLRTYRTIPYVALQLSPAAVSALQRSGLAANISENRIVTTELDTSTGVVEASETRTLGRTGAGRNVVVVDTGVAKGHPFLRNAPSGVGNPTTPKVVAEACFSSTITNATSVCPNGSSFSNSAGSGEPCTFDPSCDHGTHVAGIAVGFQSQLQTVGTTDPQAGVAPGANLISVQVFSKIGPPSGPWTLGAVISDILAALDYVKATLVPSYAIDAVNLSLGAQFLTECDNELGKPAIDNLRSAKVATVIAAGNNGVKQSSATNGHVAWPACISTAVAVGATDNQDNVAWFSNSTGEVDLLAPGVGIKSSVPGGYAVKSGTSMAAPHVTGAIAVMRAVKPTASVNTMVSHLDGSGKPVPDSANGIVKPRVRLLSASVRLADTGFRSAGQWTGPGVAVASGGVGLRPANSGTITLAGVPASPSVTTAFLYWMTLGGPDSSVVFQNQNRTGQLLGASVNTFKSGDNVNQQGPNRLYRATLPASTILPGVNGTYAVAGLGSTGPGGAEVQGSSLVVIYRDPAVTQPGGVVLRHGAMTVSGFAQWTITDTFAPAIASTPTSVRMNVGMAGGDPNTTEYPMKFDSVALPTVFDGLAGPRWDDESVAVPANLLPAGNQGHTLSLQTGTAGLAWGYVALTYRS